MPLITIVIALIVVGLLLWLVGMLPLDPTIHMIIRVLVIIVTVLWILKALGVWGAVNSVQI